jgi:acetoin utilization protein AcuB
MNVSDLMTPNPQTIYPRDLLSLADQKMRQQHFRRLPVVDDSGNLIGIITDGDLRQHTGYHATTKVTAAMVEKVVTVSSDASIETAAELMIQHKIGGLPVVDRSGRLVGIITESDLLRALTKHLPAKGREAPV